MILVAFLLQQWLQERTSLLRYTYVACLVIFCIEPVVRFLYGPDVTIHTQWLHFDTTDLG